MLRDRFVCGIAHPAVQKQLLTESDLTFTKAVTVAQVVELAEKGAQQIQPSVDKEPKEVHKFSTTNAKPPGAVKNKDGSSTDKSTSAHCYRCGGKHNQQTCQFKVSITFAINVVTSPKFVRARNVSYHRVNLLIR